MNFRIKKIIKYKFRLEHTVIPFFLMFVFVVKPFLENNRDFFLQGKVQKETTKIHTYKEKSNTSSRLNRNKTDGSQLNKTEKENTDTLVKTATNQQLINIEIEDLSQPNIEEQEQELSKTSSMLRRTLLVDLSSPAMVINFTAYSINTEFEKWLSKDRAAKGRLDGNKNTSSKNAKFNLFSPLYEKSNNLPFIKTNFHQTNEKNQINLRIEPTWFTKQSIANENTFFDYDIYLKPKQINFNNPIK